MKVQINTRRKWKRLMEVGDINALAELTELHPTTISKIIHGHRSATMSTLTKISDYFKNKQNKLSQL